ncbi:MAG: hypothetical protein U1E53_04640 [Dongiaceae bacterium]
MRFATGLLLLMLGAALAGCASSAPAGESAATGDKYQGYIEVGGGVRF